LLFTKIPGPRPVPLNVKIPGSNAAIEISTGLLESGPTCARSIYLPGARSKGTRALICVGETENRGSATSPFAVATNTRVDASDVGNDSVAIAFVEARLSPAIDRIAPGPKDVFALKVTPSEIESVSNAGGTTAVAVNVTDSVPVAARTWTVPG